jgi:hypothetical protein
MSDKQQTEDRPTATPLIANKPGKGSSLALIDIDMSKSGVQGDVVVSKGRSCTFVTELPDSEKAAARR